MYDYLSKYKMCKEYFFIEDEECFFIKNENEVYYIDNSISRDLRILEEHEEKGDVNLLKDIKNTDEDLVTFLEEILKELNIREVNTVIYIGIICECDIYDVIVNHSENIKNLNFIHIDICNIECINDFELEFCIVINKFESSEMFNNINIKLREKKIPWLRAVISISSINMGPIFIPDSTCCYECYEIRKLSNVNDFNGHSKTIEIFDKVSYRYKNKISDELISLASNFCISETINYLNGISKLIGKEHIIDIENYEVHKNFIYKVPNCDCESICRI